MVVIEHDREIGNLEMIVESLGQGFTWLLLLSPEHMDESNNPGNGGFNS